MEILLIQRESEKVFPKFSQNSWEKSYIGNSKVIYQYSYNDS